MKLIASDEVCCTGANWIVRGEFPPCASSLLVAAGGINKVFDVAGVADVAGVSDVDGSSSPVRIGAEGAEEADGTAS